MQTLVEIELFVEKMKCYSRKCTQCGHTMTITPRKPKKVCRWCGKMNYYDEKTKFIEKLKNDLKK